MKDFRFLRNPLSHQWVVLAPRRAHRPEDLGHRSVSCAFCPENITKEQELFQIRGERDDSWQVVVIPNKFPFANIHELFILTPRHSESFMTLPLEQLEIVLQAYRMRFHTHEQKGSVYIFHNNGGAAGESMKHPHSQLVVIPEEMTESIPRLPFTITPAAVSFHFDLWCPPDSEWSDEVWIVPKKRQQTFGDTEDAQLSSLAFCLQRLLSIMHLRYENDFPFNFYIYPGKDWYLRLVPRNKTIGGFEVGTKIFVNTQRPEDTAAFLASHFHAPDEARITTWHKASYHKGR